MSAGRPAPIPTLRATLERDRIELRIKRMTVTITVLRQLASDRRRGSGETPPHLRRSIADFEAQIAALTARLRDLSLTSGKEEMAIPQITPLG